MSGHGEHLTQSKENESNDYGCRYRHHTAIARVVCCLSIPDTWRKRKSPAWRRLGGRATEPFQGGEELGQIPPRESTRRSATCSVNNGRVVSGERLTENPLS